MPVHNQSGNTLGRGHRAVVELFEPRLLLTAYYVSASAAPNGNGSISAPFQTIQAAANIVNAGDVVNIAGGTYTNPVRLFRSGTAENPIIFQKQSGTVTIQMSSRWAADAAVHVDGARHLILDGIGTLDIGSDTPSKTLFGYRILDATNVTVKNAHTKDHSLSGLLAKDSSQIYFRSNWVENCGTLGPDGNNELITIASVNTFEVTGNTVDGGGREGIDAKEASTHGLIADNHVFGTQRLGIYIDAYANDLSDIEVTRNVVHDTKAFGIVIGSEMGGTASNVRITNNVVYGNALHGIVVASFVENGPRRDILIANNTVYGNGVGTTFGGGILVQTSNATNIRIRNNIVANNGDGQIGTVIPAQTTVTNNVSYGTAFGAIWGATLGSPGLQADPRFVAPASHDFRLQANSPAIDFGAWTEAPANDYLQITRQIAPEAGAYEYPVPVYPLGFAWDREADWTPGPTASSSVGNPDDDANAYPTWHYEYATGNPLSSANPWYTSVRTSLVWDTSWFGEPDGWVKANDIGCVIHYNRLVHVLNASGRAQIPVIRWANPTAQAQTLDITGTLRLNWINGAAGDADLALIRVTETGESIPLYTATRNSSGGLQTLSIDVPNLQIGAGDSILLSVRGQGTLGVVVLSDDLVYRIDPDRPAVASTVVNDGNVQRSMVKSLTVRFNENVTLTPDAISLLYSSGSPVPGLIVKATNPSGDERTWEVSFPDSPLIGGSLADGTYSLRISSAGVRDNSNQQLAGAYSFAFHRLFGDSDGDRDVDSVDSLRLRLSLGALSGSANYRWYFDFDGDGDIDSVDSLRFRMRQGTIWS